MNDANDEDKDAFYEMLQKEIDTMPLHHLLILLGDANAKWDLTTLAGKAPRVMKDSAP